MGGGDPSSDMKVLDLRSSQFEVNSRRMVVTFILSRYWIGESIANSSKQWCAITNLYGLAQKCQLTTDKYSLACPKPTQENLLCLFLANISNLLRVWISYRLFNELFCQRHIDK